MSNYKGLNTTTISAVANNEQNVKDMLSKIKWAYKNNTKALLPRRIGLGSVITVDDISIGGTVYEGLTLQTLSSGHRVINTTVSVDFVSTNMFNSKIGIKIDDTIIILVDSDKVYKLKSYLFSGTDDASSYTSSKSISGITYTLSTIEQKVIALKNTLIANNTFESLNDKEYFILDLPIIMWKLGWFHSSVCQINWVNAGISLVFDNFFCGQTEKRSKTKVSEAENQIRNCIYGTELFAQDIPSAKINYDNLVTTCQSMTIGNSMLFGDFTNLPNDINDPIPSNFIGSTSIGSALGDLDDLGASLGLYRYSKYVKGNITKINANLAEFNISAVAFRFSDTFTFDDTSGIGTSLQGGSQLLGSWIDNVYDIKIAEDNWIEYDGLIQLSNKNYRDFKAKTNRGINYLIYTPNTIKTIGTGTNQLNITHNPIKIIL